MTENEEKTPRVLTARAVARTIKAITPELLASFKTEQVLELRDVYIPELVAAINVDCLARAKKLAPRTP